VEKPASAVASAGRIGAAARKMQSGMVNNLVVLIR